MKQRGQLAAPVASSQWRWHLTALALAAGGLAVAGVLISLSDGFYHDDDLTHYNFARAGWHSAGSLLYRWARPGYNVPAAVVAHWGGLLGCRIFSALQTAAVGFLAYLIARRIGVPPAAAAMAPALVWLQPLTMTLACTTPPVRGDLAVMTADDAVGTRAPVRGPEAMTRGSPSRSRR